MPDHESPIENEAQPSNKARRDLLLGIGAATAVAYAGSAAAAMPGHDHSKHSPQNPGLLDATNDCLDTGQRCIAHCLVSFQEGDTDAGRNLGGFYIQNAPDADVATSDGVFVFDGSNPQTDVEAGDLVRVSGSVTEYFGETQIAATDVTVVGQEVSSRSR